MYYIISLSLYFFISPSRALSVSTYICLSVPSIPFSPDFFISFSGILDQLPLSESLKDVTKRYVPYVCCTLVTLFSYFDFHLIVKQHSFIFYFIYTFWVTKMFVFFDVFIISSTSFFLSLWSLVFLPYLVYSLLFF